MAKCYFFTNELGQKSKFLMIRLIIAPENKMPQLDKAWVSDARLSSWVFGILVLVLILPWIFASSNI